MRRISAKQIQDTVKALCLQANYVIGQDIIHKLRDGLQNEESETGKAILRQILANDEIAAKEQMAICQDTGMAIVFISLGQEVLIEGGDFNKAVNQGVKEAYTQGYLRKSVVDDPLFDRHNTNDNTPAIIHLQMAQGDKMTIEVMAKGFGSENMSALRMLTPSQGEEGVRQFVVETVRKAGPNPCPPIIVGVGIGGSVERCALIAKKATMREIGKYNADPRYQKLEEDILKEINGLGIGPGGLGGRMTALAVHVEYVPAHIASMPCVVNICCHAARHARAEI